LNPHAKQTECEAAYASGKLLGCGKAFKYDGTKAIPLTWKQVQEEETLLQK
jgi:hypothetical protein